MSRNKTTSKKFEIKNLIFNFTGQMSKKQKHQYGNQKVGKSKLGE